MPYDRVRRSGYNRVVDGFKVCGRCSVSKQVSEFYDKRLRSGVIIPHSMCKECFLSRDKCPATRGLKDRQLAKAATRRREIRVKVLRAYGGEYPRCACCGEDTYEFLAIDHVDNNGAAHRKLLGGTAGVYNWLVREGFPPGFQVLCHNCNMAKGFYGVCPHQRSKAS